MVIKKNRDDDYITRGPVRHILCLDGTGQTLKQKKGVPKTNVGKIFRAIADISDDGRPQYGVYINGIGVQIKSEDQDAHISWATATWNAATGYGIERQIMQAYEYLCRHWKPGDDITNISYSRGGFAARSLAGMVHKCGIIDREKLAEERGIGDLESEEFKTYLKIKIAEAFDLYKNRDIAPQSEKAKNWRTLNAHCEEDCDQSPARFNQIVFDPVPGTKLAEKLPDFLIPELYRDHNFTFKDNRIPPNTEKIYTILSADEFRTLYDYLPADHDPKHPGVTIKEMIGNGGHSAIGGGDARTEPLANAYAISALEDMKHTITMDTDKMEMQFPSSKTDPLHFLRPSDEFYNTMSFSKRWGNQALDSLSRLFGKGAKVAPRVFDQNDPTLFVDPITVQRVVVTDAQHIPKSLRGNAQLDRQVVQEMTKDVTTPFKPFQVTKEIPKLKRNFKYPRSSAACGSGWGASTYAAPSLRSDEYAHASR